MVWMGGGGGDAAGLHQYRNGVRSFHVVATLFVYEYVDGVSSSMKCESKCVLH